MIQVFSTMAGLLLPLACLKDGKVAQTCPVPAQVVFTDGLRAKSGPKKRHECVYGKGGSYASVPEGHEIAFSPAGAKVEVTENFVVDGKRITLKATEPRGFEVSYGTQVIHTEMMRAELKGIITIAGKHYVWIASGDEDGEGEQLLTLDGERVGAVWCGH